MQGSVTVHVDAPPEKVWELVSDITQIGRFSPETFEAEWIEGAIGPAVGAQFRGHVRRHGWKWLVYWTKCTVVTCEPARDFAFVVGTPKNWVNTWSYHLEPSGSGTDVTESFELVDKAAMRWYWKVAGQGRGRTNEEGMRRTLERVKDAAEAETAHGPAAGGSE
jgi:uncharacterized protein YndB with AHSA1/START domain